MSGSSIKALILIFVYFLVANSTIAQPKKIDREPPKNIILMVGDGMGPAHMKAYRLFKDDPDTPEIEQTTFDRFLIGSISTDPDMDAGMVTDSAASATAYAIGKKSYNGAIGIDAQKQTHTTALQWAKKQGKSTGLVATSQVVHATPAAFAAHVESRRGYNDIADQFFDNQYKGMPYIDVILGGGTKYFSRSDRDLIQLFRDKSYDYVTTKQQLFQSKGRQVIGLFAEKGLPNWHERGEQHPSLAQMTVSAIERLSQNEKGFFLVIEGSQIDWESHSNNIHGTVYEMQDFDLAFQAVQQFAGNRKDTLVLLTADHETGGLSIGRKTDSDAKYEWNPKPLRVMQRSLKQAMIDLAKIEPAKRVEWVASEMGLSLNNEQAKTIQSFVLDDETYMWLNDIISQQTATGWTTTGHTGVDVNLYGFGAGVEAFYGHLSNHVLGQKLIELVK
jgi:alkaline phosphatase